TREHCGGYIICGAVEQPSAENLKGSSGGLRRTLGEEFALDWRLRQPVLGTTLGPRRWQADRGMGRGQWPFRVFILAWSAGLPALYGLGNDFPIPWHFDAPSKVAQIIDHSWNFRHPLLLLRVTQAALSLWADNPTPQQIASTGQWVSAVAAS